MQRVLIAFGGLLSSRSMVRINQGVLAATPVALSGLLGAILSCKLPLLRRIVRRFAPGPAALVRLLRFSHISSQH